MCPQGERYSAVFDAKVGENNLLEPSRPGLTKIFYGACLWGLGRSLQHASIACGEFLCVRMCAHLDVGMPETALEFPLYNSLTV